MAGFSFGDCPSTGVSIHCSTLGSWEVAQQEVLVMADYAWSERHAGNVVGATLEQQLPQIRRAVAEPVRKGPVLIVEPADNIGGGAPGNNAVLHSLVKERLGDAVVIINDPAAVAQLRQQQTAIQTQPPFAFVVLRLQ